MSVHTSFTQLDDRKFASAHSDVEQVRFRPPARLLAIFGLLLVSCVTWRSGVYYEGGADTVVLAKAALASIAFLLALSAPADPFAWAQIRATPAIWLAAYVLLAAVSGLVHGAQPLASVVLPARLALVAVILILVVRAYHWRCIFTALAVAMLTLGVFSGLTGLGEASDGRLGGGIPPMSPNEIALLTSIPVIMLTWVWLNQRSTWSCVVGVPLLLAVVWMTGSRAGFVTLVLILLVLGLTARRIPIAAFTVGCLSAPVLVVIAGWTGVLSSFVERGDAETLTTLNSRTVAWTAAVDYTDTLGEQLIGMGLSVKEIPVSALYRDEQILDSTWVSALLQVGIVGVILLALFVMSTLRACVRAPRPERALYLATVLYVVVVSVLESGLFDSTVAFIVFFTVALCANRTPPRQVTL